MHTKDPNSDSEPNSQDQKSSLLVEIGRGWEWVVFSVKVLSRVGSPYEILKTILNSIKILVSRTLRQWGFGGK
ncbi:hypothetical protein [Pseudanabaena mucicola]|uniref:Uncharacterized protein n=1 Tax=Pseudanabaena mucicola FACHB-723 TaxID=2692860 RepID=A0ABR7ZXZ3_9CYAN|nr:hypothetical protein [Pseudanabaena mucicola]MBD2188375.1 hypothetical protein [Pseudanabaena mucicola FACHB-723]